MVFIDAVDDSELRWEIPKIPLAPLRAAAYVIVRCSRNAAEELAEVRGELGCGGSWFLLTHPAGGPPRLTDVHQHQQLSAFRAEPAPPDAPEVADLIHRCRAVEFAAMLSWGRAVTAPKNFHFRLPSGRHAATYVRAAAMLSTERDALVVAMWLLEYCAGGDGTTAILLDTPGLLPVSLALRYLVAQRSGSVVTAKVLSGYPHTHLAIAEAVADVAAEGPEAVLACVSVSSTGQLVTRLRNELVHMDGLGGCAVVALVRLGQDANAEPLVGPVRVADFVRMTPGDGPYTAFASSCELCTDARRSTAVPVDGNSLDIVFPGLVRRVMPVSPFAEPDLVRPLWEACDVQNAVSFYAAADPAAEPWRAPAERLGIKIDLTRLIEDPRFREVLVERLAGELRVAPDLILVSGADANRKGWPALRHAIDRRIQAHQVMVYPLRGAWPDAAVTAVREARSIVVFTLGGVTGGTLMAGLMGVQKHRTGTSPDYSVRGVVAHSRPSSEAAWQGIKNAYPELTSLWHTPLPDESPFYTENDLLNAAADVKSQHAIDLLGERLAFSLGKLRPEELTLGGVLLGASPNMRISPNSLFGQDLGGASIAAAAGAAIHTRRLEFEGRARICRFDIARMSKSFYDPMIFCAMMRWMRPNEVGWGDSLEDAQVTIHQAFERAKRFGDGGATVLVCELLVGLRQGKVPSKLKGHLAGMAREQMGRDRGAGGALELALAINHIKEVTSREGPPVPSVIKPQAPPTSRRRDLVRRLRSVADRWLRG